MMSCNVSKTDTQLTHRKVTFDFSKTTLHWIPSDPFTSQFLSVIHTILPAGEFFFCRLYNKAKHDITDEKLLDDVNGFIRQEATHARAHNTGTNDLLIKQGVDVQPYIDKIEWLFNVLLSDTPLGYTLSKNAEKRWLIARLGLVAAIEHFTCVLGKYALENTRWDEMNADPVILDILRWHAAEEIEHRSVAFDVYQHLSGNYLMRYLHMLIAATGIISLWALGATDLMKQDPTFSAQKPKILGRFFWSTWQNRANKGRLPSIATLVVISFRYLHPSYNPANEADTQQALDYLSNSPAAKQAATVEIAA